MTDNNLKHLLFYSNYCNFSNEIYQTIIKYNLKDEFHLLNISKARYNIPNIITSVPTLLLNDKKTIYKNNELEEFIQELYKKKSENDVLPSSDYTQHFSSAYSSWDETNNINDNYNQFGLINDKNNIITPEEDTSSNNLNDSSLSEKMNTYQENRNLDIQNIFKDTKKQI
jgi:hypothetical protein